MTTTETETTDITIDRPVEAVWALVGDFGGWGWMPGLESVTVEGDVRTIEVMGMAIDEQLISLDHDEHEMTYSIVGGPVPVDSHQATIAVVPVGDGCRVSWSVTSAPEGTAAFFRDTYAGALQALKAKAESGG